MRDLLFDLGLDCLLEVKRGGWGGSLVFVQVVEVELEQPRGFVGILFVEWHEAIAEVEGYGCGIGIDGDEAAAGLVVGCEVALDEIEQRTSDIHTFC